jgi:hypothetical protein
LSNQKIKVGKLTIRASSELQVIEKIDLDSFFEECKESRKHADAALAIKLRDKEITMIIEETSLIHTDDFNKITSTEEELKRRNKINSTRQFIMRIIHCKRGINWIILSMAKSYKVELQECGDFIRLDELLRKRFRFL